MWLLIHVGKTDLYQTVAKHKEARIVCFILRAYGAGLIVDTLVGNENNLTLKSIRGPFRPESNFAYTQHWYHADVTLKTLSILQPHLSEWRKPIKILKRKSRITLYRSKKIPP